VDSLLVEQRIGTLMAEIKAKYEERGRKQLEEMMKQMMTFLSNHFPPYPPPPSPVICSFFLLYKKICNLFLKLN
jgi:CRISPR/Cas system-associated exonuclease Cas4 (RecB family)